MPWIKVVHTCQMPRLTIKEGKGSVWACEHCGCLYEVTVNANSLYIGSPWKLIGEGQNNDST